MKPPKMIRIKKHKKKIHEQDHETKKEEKKSTIDPLVPPKVTFF
jgi:hypothetical protein